MALLVTGSIGIDTVDTPHGRAENVLGGSAVYFAFAATHFAPVRLVGVVGADFPAGFRKVLDSRSIDLAGLEVRDKSKTFRWHGKYHNDMNERDTVDVHLNVLEERGPRVPKSFADSKFVFLANTHPDLQRELLGQVSDPAVAVCDTMDLWITTERESLIETLGQVNGVIVNDGEARQLTERLNVIDAGEAILGYGPSFAIIKRGEHGAMLVCEEGVTSLPSFPTKAVKDPTGAGDAFAGGVMGYIASTGKCDYASLRQAMMVGTVTASYAIEDFSLEGLRHLAEGDLKRRMDDYRTMLRLD